MNDLEKHITHWKTGAADDWKTAEYLFDGRRYSACLFFCHLAVEKLLKGLVIQNTKEASPYTHDLAYLSKLAGSNPTDRQSEHLKTITTFNISGRYSSDKQAFHKQCTRAYAAEHFANAKQIFLWLKKQYPKP